jgi:hypothetical protein
MTQIRATSTLNEDNKMTSAIKDEVKRLMKENYNFDSRLVTHLRSKYTDDSVIEGILELFRDRQTMINEKAEHFVRKFNKHYGSDLPLHEILNKALKYKSKYNLSDDEFDAVKRIFETQIFTGVNTYRKDGNNYPNTNLGRALGSAYTEVNDGIRTVSNEDYQHIQSLLRIYGVTKSLHSQIILQTATYKHLDDVAMTGKFDINKHNPLSAVHPVVAALFLPKIREVEQRMLFSNIAGIVDSRYNKTPITTKPDYELLYYLINDPADVVCSNESPLKDLLDRSSVQVQLWNSVYNLRLGKYFDAASIDFVNTIENCKISNYDNPDLVLLGDEGIILRRLFNIFAFRPILVQTVPVFGNFTHNPYNIPVVNNVITTIPYITYRIPAFNVNNQVFDLEQSSGIVQFYLENDNFVPKATTIFEVKGPLVYYVPRRSMQIPLITPFTLQALPVTTKGNIKTITTEVKIPDSLNIGNVSGNAKFDAARNKYLKSVVSLDIANVDNLDDALMTQLITGHNTFLPKYIESETGVIYYPSISSVYCYAPHKVMSDDTRSAIFKVSEENYRKNIAYCGTIFIYDSCVMDL